MPLYLHFIDIFQLLLILVGRPNDAARKGVMDHIDRQAIDGLFAKLCQASMTTVTIPSK